MGFPYFLITPFKNIHLCQAAPFFEVSHDTTFLSLCENYYMFSSELLIQMCTKTLPLGSLYVFVCAEEVEQVGPRGVKGYEARNHASTQSSGQILSFTGTRRLPSNQLFIIVSLIIMFPEDFHSCIFP